MDRWVREELVKRYENCEEYVLVCQRCGEKLAILYRAGSAYQVFPYFNGCEHFKWEIIGNGCLIYPESEICRPVRKIIENAVRIYQNGTNVYLLLPR